jgi:DNA-binding CsgD family transcriptional regulator/PAS domain-containing protein
LNASSIGFEPAGLSELIGLGYEAARSRQAWRAFASHLATASGSQVATIQYMDDDQPERSFLVAGGLGSEYEEAFATTSWQNDEDRFWTTMRDQPSRTIRLSNEIVSRADMRKNFAYRYLAKPWKLEHYLLSTIRTGNGISAFLSLGRTAGNPPFEHGDKQVFSKMVLSHVERSMALHKALADTQAAKAALSAVADMPPHGLVVFDSAGRSLFVNKKAAEIFGASQGLAFVNGHLHASTPEAHGRLENAMSMAVHGAMGAVIPAPDPVIVPREGHVQPYHVTFSQLNSRDGYRDIPAHSAVAALIHEDWLAGRQYLPKMLRSTYHLTDAEIRLCVAMIDGKSLLQAAKTLNISRNTAKTHLNRVFNKTGVHSQAALLALLSTGRRPKLPILKGPSTARSLSDL